MLRHTIKQDAGQRRLSAAGFIAACFRVIACMLLLPGSGLFPPALQGEDNGIDPPAPLPLLVRARQGDTPASIARHYLNDASRGWMINEYNEKGILSGGEAILVPTAPFRPGGLTPAGYQTVPVLAYLGIGETPGHRRQVSRAAFNQQMDRLETEGFKAITPAQLVDFIKFSGQLPRRSVLITFDTVSTGVHDIAIPILKAHGFTATVFVATDRVGRNGAMNWEQIRQLHADGVTIACRGRSGRALTRQVNEQAFDAYFLSTESELRLSRKAIETHLDAPCLFMAYPGGSTSSLVSAMVAKIGFSAAFSLQPGHNPFFGDRFAIHRTLIDSRTGPDQFNAHLSTLIKADLN
jgi:peptidoglycan/xylan/chitin deacetylase (PgdA/CDA1 family)